MRTINRLKRTENRLSAKGEYKLYIYEVIDDMGNKDEVSALQEYEPEEKVRYWFDEQYNRPKIGKLCQLCLKPIKNTTELQNHKCYY